MIAAGWSARALTTAVRSGTLLRARQDVYLLPETDADCVAACAVGGRLTCVSELSRWGVFVHDSAALHVQVMRHQSRLRHPARATIVHWAVDGGAETPEPGEVSTTLLEALVCAVHCQSDHAAVATLDSACRLGLVDDADIAEVFRRLPRRFQRLRRRLDPRAESGTETLVRLLLVRLGCHIELQVRIDGVGRVDLLIDGWLIVECDSREHHGSWEERRRDLRRDQAAAALGYTTYRPIAEDILWHPERVLAAIRGHLGARRGR